MNTEELVIKLDNNEIKDIDELEILMDHYEKQNDIDNMIKCYEYGSKVLDEYIDVYSIMKYYYDNKNYDEAIKYMDIMLEIDKKTDLEVHAMCDLADYLKANNQIDKMKDYLNRLVERGISIGMTKLGHYYSEIDDDVNMEKYYLMAIENGCDESVYFYSYIL